MIEVEFRGKYGKVEYQTLYSAAADICAQPPSNEEQANSSCWRKGHSYPEGVWILNPMDWCVVPTGLFIVRSEIVHISSVRLIPYLEITPRSGLSMRQALSSPNSPSVIDMDYIEKEIGCILQNLGRQPVVLRLGERIAQIKGCYSFNMDGINRLDIPRTGGFGSSGK